MNGNMAEDFIMTESEFAESVCKKIDFFADEKIRTTLYIATLMRLLQNTMTYNMDRQLKDLDLTSSQLEVILFLISQDDKEVNQKDIEHRFNLKNPTVTGLLKRLEMKGFIKRYASEHDGRYKRIELTEKTQLLKENMYNSIVKYSKEFFEGITEDEKETLVNILIKLNRNVGILVKKSK